MKLRSLVMMKDWGRPYRLIIQGAIIIYLRGDSITIAPCIFLDNPSFKTTKSLTYKKGFVTSRLHEQYQAIYKCM